MLCIILIIVAGIMISLVNIEFIPLINNYNYKKITKVGAIIGFLLVIISIIAL